VVGLLGSVAAVHSSHARLRCGPRHPSGLGCGTRGRFSLLQFTEDGDGRGCRIGLLVAHSASLQEGKDTVSCEQLGCGRWHDLGESVAGVSCVRGACAAVQQMQHMRDATSFWYPVWAASRGTATGHMAHRAHMHQVAPERSGAATVQQGCRGETCISVQRFHFQRFQNHNDRGVMLR
jgi:hypothetical protein